ncbi:hypothetical protein [Roseovarius azorensis]|nr:hypothetical protein [Roseovarius azorensis]
MSNRIAIILGATLFVLIGADITMNESAGLVFAGRKLVDLIEYLAFWR